MDDNTVDLVMDPVKLEKYEASKRDDKNFNFETVFSNQANPIPKPPKQKKKTASKKSEGVLRVF